MKKKKVRLKYSFTANRQYFKSRLSEPYLVIIMYEYNVFTKPLLTLHKVYCYQKLLIVFDWLKAVLFLQNITEQSLKNTWKPLNSN